MITKENIELLEQLQANGETLEDAITKGKQLLALQDARQQAIQRIANEYFAIDQDIRAGKYDNTLETIGILTNSVQKSILE